MTIILVALATAGCRRVHEALPVHSPPEAVPEAFQMIYRELDAEFLRQLPLISLPWGQPADRTAFGVELPAADGPVPKTTALALDRLKDLGVRCVALRLHYPVLTHRHPHSAEYRAFYRRLTAEIRRRDLGIVVAMGSAAREPELGLSRERFASGLREMAEAVIADIRPDHLTLLAEPDTQTRNTGLTFSPAEFAATVKQVARGLQPTGTRIGAGAGTWTALEYFKALAELPELDYLDLRIHPIQHGFAAERAVKAAEIARSAGKGVGIGAAWLYKVWGREFTRVSPVEASSRDVYSFWQPLDAHFIELVANLARSIEAEFCSFSGMNYLFGYLGYTADTGRLRPDELVQRSDQVADDNLRRGVLSATGEKFKRTIQP
jgi:hypothetical protein